MVLSVTVGAGLGGGAVEAAAEEVALLAAGAELGERDLGLAGDELTVAAAGDAEAVTSDFHQAALLLV